MNETPSTPEDLVHIWQPNICAGSCSARGPACSQPRNIGERQEDILNTNLNRTVGPGYNNTLILCNMQALHKLPVNATCQAFQTDSLCSNPPRPPPPLFNLIYECGIVRRYNTYTHTITHTHTLTHREGKVCSGKSRNRCPRSPSLSGM